MPNAIRTGRMVLTVGVFFAVAFRFQPYSAQFRQASQLRSVLHAVPAARVDIVGTNVVLSGQLDSLESVGYVANLTESLNRNSTATRVVNLTRLSESAKQAVAQKIERAIARGEIGVSFVSDRVLIEGSADSDFEADRAVEVTRALLSAGASDWPARLLAKEVATAGGNAPVIVDMLRVKPRVTGRLK